MFLAMLHLLSIWGLDPESLTRRAHTQRPNETSSTSSSSSQLLKEGTRPAPSEANRPTGFFAGASNVDARNGTFNDVTGNQYNLNKYDIKVEMQDNDRLLLDKLPNVVNAGYQSVDHETCLTGTRREELRRIEEWEADHKDKRVYWLNGLAGSGKSTIARTFAERSSETGKLGASFFCSRDFEDRRNIRLIFPTLAYELAYRYTEFKTALIPIIESNPNIGHTLPSTQLERLLVRPLKSIGLYTTIVIDALDECKEDQPASTILSLLGKYIDEIPFVKFFITGRPEPPIQSGFRLPLLRPHAEVFLLHEVNRESVDHDINLYVKTRLSEIVTWTDYDLPVPWPTDKEINAIVENSSGLFIISSITVRFIGSRFHDPQERMKMFISRPESTIHEGKLGIDGTYRQVFLQSCENLDTDDDDVFERLRLVIGSIVLVLNPLSCTSLAEILGISRGNIRNAAKIFHSVLIVPNSDLDPMRICHKSLADFVTDANRCTDKRFHIDPSIYHKKLGTSCLRLMNEMLKRNICDLPPYTMNEDVGDLVQRREKYIGGGLEYACRSWAKHLCLVSSHGEHVGDVIKSLECFFHHKLLSWLEVLSIIGDLGCAVYSLRDVRGWLTEVRYTDTSLLALVRDSERFVLCFFDAIAASAPHIYDSGLLFCPTTCHVRARYQGQIQTKVKVLNATDDSWDACSRSIRTQSRVRSMEFSHRSDLIAVGEDGCVEIFEAVTGQRRAIFTLTTGSRCWSVPLAFSHDDTLLVAGYEDGTVYVWNLQTGGLVGALKGNTRGKILSVAFSPCGAMIASGLSNDTIRIWSVSTLECLCILEGHSPENLCWLGTGSGIILGSSSRHDKTVRLWDIFGARCLKTFTELTTLFVGHSRSSLLLACYSSVDEVGGGEIKAIDAGTGDVIQTIPTNGSVEWIRFSNQDKIMYTSKSMYDPTDGTFFIHDLATNNNLLTFKYEGNPTAVSSDGSCIASSFSGFVRIWQTDNTSGKNNVARLEFRREVAFSGDGQLIASVTSGGSAQMWEAMSVGHVQSYLLWSWPASMVRFSPDRNQLASLASSSMIPATILKLWEVATGDFLASMELDDYFDSFVFGSDGGSLILSFSEKTQDRKGWSISPNTSDLSTKRASNSLLPMKFVPIRDTQLPPPSDVPSHQVYYECMGEWILDKQKRRVCWVLPDMRSECRDFCGEKVVIGCNNKKVMIVDISGV